MTVPRRLTLCVAGVVALLVAAAPAGHGPFVAPVDRLATAAEPAVTATHGFVLRQPEVAAPAPVLSPSGRIDLTDLRPGDLVDVEDWGKPLTLASAKRPLRQQVRSAGRDRVVVPALKVAMPLVASPTTRNGRLVVPGGVRAVGWSDATVPPGARRSTSLLATHKDTGGGSRGYRSPLYDAAASLKKGAKVVIHWKRTRTVYRVSRVTSHRKDRLPAGLVRRGGNHHRVALIMCGGPLRVGSDGVARWSRADVIWAKAVPRTR
ncbi:MAG: class F sortase [Nocardioides sp.]|nr:class F sortase [Nocardioides sp.]